MIACYKGHFRIAKFLLSLDANVNRKSVKGNTALHDCAESGSLEILKLLIEHGAKMDVDSYGMQFTLHYTLKCSENVKMQSFSVYIHVLSLLVICILVAGVFVECSVVTWHRIFLKLFLYTYTCTFLSI